MFPSLPSEQLTSVVPTTPGARAAGILSLLERNPRRGMARHLIHSHMVLREPGPPSRSGALEIACVTISSPGRKTKLVFRPLSAGWSPQAPPPQVPDPAPVSERLWRSLAMLWPEAWPKGPWRKGASAGQCGPQQGGFAHVGKAENTVLDPVE